MIRLQNHLSLPALTFFVILISGCEVPENSEGLSTIEPINHAMGKATKPRLPQGVDIAVECAPFVLEHEQDHPSLDLLKRDWCGKQEPNGDIFIPAEVMEKTGRFAYPPSHPGQSYPPKLDCNLIALSNGTIKHAYDRKDGRARLAQFPHDNYCELYRKGVFISYTDGKAGFYDGDLNLVHQTDYLIADAFYRGLAKVCSKIPDKKYELEHFHWVGGKCGYIGTDYKVVVPIEHPYESTPLPPELQRD